MNVVKSVTAPAVWSWGGVAPEPGEGSVWSWGGVAPRDVWSWGG